jgi:geranylgeranyl pyrophosphate synthase
VDAAFNRAVTYAQSAKQQLAAAFPASAERDGLLALTDYVLNRDR